MRHTPCDTHHVAHHMAHTAAEQASVHRPTPRTPDTGRARTRHHLLCAQLLYCGTKKLLLLGRARRRRRWRRCFSRTPRAQQRRAAQDGGRLVPHQLVEARLGLARSTRLRGRRRVRMTRRAQPTLRPVALLVHLGGALLTLTSVQVRSASCRPVLLRLGGGDRRQHASAGVVLRNEVCTIAHLQPAEGAQLIPPPLWSCSSRHAGQEGSTWPRFSLTRGWTRTR